MKIRIWTGVWALAVAVIVATGCGGGGGGTGTTGGTTQVLTGRVLDVVSTGPVTPVATVSVATGESTTTSTSDGFFLLDVPITAAAANVATGSYGTWTFAFPPSATDLDLGDLWVGPQKVILTGTVKDSVTNDPIPNALVAFAGRSARTNGSGVFSLADVAYSNTSQTGFWSIEGRVQSDGYFANGFTANGKVASAGTVSVGTILLVSSGTGTPPGGPYNVYGIARKAGAGVAATIDIFKGATEVRQVTAAADGRYYVWLPVGTYQLKPTFSGTTGPNVSVNITQSNQILNQDLAIP